MRRVLTVTVLTFVVLASTSISTQAASLCESVAGNLVTNCGFETSTFDSWVQSGEPNQTFVNSDGPYTHSGHWGAKLGPSRAVGFLSQTLPTVAGGTYKLTFWMRNDDQYLPNNFSVTWGGSSVYHVDNYPPSPWTEFNFPSLTAGGNTVLKFGFQQVPSFFGLDDISVVPTSSTAAAEPSSLMLLGSVLLAAAVMFRRKIFGC